MKKRLRLRMFMQMIDSEKNDALTSAGLNPDDLEDMGYFERREALEEAGVTFDDIDAIAVTHAPGLLGSLLIGTLTARTLAVLHNKPLYAVHHLKSHVYANWLSPERQAKFSSIFVNSLLNSFSFCISVKGLLRTSFEYARFISLFIKNKICSNVSS